MCVLSFSCNNWPFKFGFGETVTEMHFLDELGFATNVIKSWIDIQACGRCDLLGGGCSPVLVVFHAMPVDKII